MLKIHFQAMYGVLCMLLMLVCVMSVCAAESDEGEYSELFDTMDSPKQISGRTVTLGGTHATIAPFMTLDREYAYDENGIAPAEHAFDVTLRDSNVSVYAEGRVSNYAGKDGKARHTAEIGEAYLRYTNRRFTLQAGNSIYAWGSADGLNPTDTINPQDERNPYDPRKLPLTSCMLQYAPVDDVIFESILIPHKQRNIRNTNEAASLPEEMFSGEIVYNADNNPAGYNHEKDVQYETTGDSLSRTRYAMRMRYAGSACDVAVSYMYDTDPCFTPRIDLVAENGTGNRIYMVDSVRLTREAVHRLGVDYKDTLGPYTLWTEACASIPYNHHLPAYRRRKSAYESTFGIDRSYGSEQRGYINLQCNVKYIPAYDDSCYADYNDGEPDPESMVDESYMREYYYRSVSRDVFGQYSVWRTTVMMHNEWEWIVNTFTLETDIGYMIPAGYTSQNSRPCGGLIFGLTGTYTLQDALQLEAGAHQTLPLAYDQDRKRIQIDHTSELQRMYQSNYVYARLTYMWDIQL